MRFYRRLRPIQALSFDLDDTLYSNQPIMLATDKKMAAYFLRIFTELGVANDSACFDFQFWWPFRQQALLENPALKHDVGLLRQRCYYLGTLSLGVAEPVAATIAEQGLRYFIEQRSNFTVPQQVHDLLALLQSKVPLVAITNGNVDTQRIGIAAYFSGHFHASMSNKLKPDADMFDKTCQLLNIRPEQLLHVGDCGRNDVFGAINAGCQTAWLNRYTVGKPLQLVPSVMLDNIEQLAQLFD
ncbi:putative hydrolase of the HAD superfamily [Colwellia chukchiensis]|uniref:Putative hydrolase of the HAD superfamily n=1 Tax=Colwellia chukchiensis TaxID=641665 RepID=A0A1H7P7X8_9GAMM|nr:HAD-IA family hydrolase [Colwellia chukchiensis]SEL31355.1 putative hydrolase of the HAD superfamily [Colwellia chukchiensis]